MYINCSNPVLWKDKDFGDLSLLLWSSGSCAVSWVALDGSRPFSGLHLSCKNYGLDFGKFKCVDFSCKVNTDRLKSN